MAKQQSHENESRLQAVMRGAFAGPPTQLKDIPEKSGESRAARKATRSNADRSNASRPRPSGPSAS